MTGGITPENTKGWFSSWLPVAERGGPILTLVLAMLLGGAVYYLLGVLDRAVQRNHALTERLLTLQDTHRQELLRYVHCERTP